MELHGFNVITFIIIYVFRLTCCFHRGFPDFISEDVAKNGGNRCQIAMKRAATIDSATIVLNTPEAIYGKWVSEGCETRPGPEFLLRSYQFHRNNTFKLVQYYYSEESCSNPGYTIVARGQLLPQEQYSLTTVSVIPNSMSIAHHLAVKINNTCPGFVRKRWKSSKEYFILNLSKDNFNNRRSVKIEDGTYKTMKKHQRYHYPEKFNCLRALSLVFHELHHYKVQIRPELNGNFRTTHFRQELLLGDIHSKLNARADYKPSAFQVPLLRVDSSTADTLGVDSASLIKSESFLNLDSKNVKENRGHVYEKSYVGHFDLGTIGELDSILASKNTEEITDEKSDAVEIFKYCHICSAVASANEKSPPYLMAKVPLPLHLSGEWVSMGCERRPMHLYLTRHFRLYTGDQSWIAEYKFYYDTSCTGSSFSVTVAGHYKVGKSNHQVSGGTEVDFHSERASLTVYDMKMMENLEHDSDCGVGEWAIGLPRDISPTNGCPTLGLTVPSVEYELLRVEEDFYGSTLLYLGQADTEGKHRGSKDRPTAYQQPLVRCRSLPSYSENLRDILSRPLYNNDYNIYDNQILTMENDFSYSSAVKLHCNIVLFVSFVMLILNR